MEERFAKPNLREFFAVIWRDWGGRVSGSLSVPFTVLGLFYERQREIWFGLACVAVLLAVYRVWAAERNTVCDLQAKLDKSTHRERIAQKLAEFIDTGQMLTAAPSQALTEVQIDEWNERCEKWLVSVCEFLRLVGSPTALSKFNDKQRNAACYEGVHTKAQNTVGLLHKRISNLLSIQEKIEAYF